MIQARALACVTGASSGLGAEFSRQLAAQGYDLLLVARRKDRLESLVLELSSAYKTSAEVFPVDLAHPGDRARLEERLEGEDRLGLLVNNAGFGTQGDFLGNSAERQEEMVQVHVLAPLCLTHAALPGLVARGCGGIINVSSVASFFPLQENVNYSATKVYLRAFSEGLAMELEGTGVRVQALCAGFTHTEFHASMGMNTHRFQLFPWMDASQVVRISLTAFQRGYPVTLIPGWRNRILVGLGGLVPHFLLGWIVQTYLKMVKGRV